MLPRTLRDNNIAIVLNLQHLAPENPTRFSGSEEIAPTDNGIDRNDAPLVGRFAVPEEGNKRAPGTQIPALKSVHPQRPRKECLCKLYQITPSL